MIRLPKLRVSVHLCVGLAIGVALSNDLKAMFISIGPIVVVVKAV